MKKIILSAAAFALVAVSGVTLAPTTAEAVPAFARQTGAACYSCHFQAIPRLAAFGRNFRMNTFRDTGDQGLIEDDALSLPASFNASLLFKARIQSADGATGAQGTGAFSTGAKTAIQWPDEAALLIGGRYGEHLGGLTEWNGGPLSYKIYYAFDLDNGTIAVGGGSTDALGTPYLFNDPSNTITRNTRGWQHRASFISNGNTLANGVSGVGVYGYLNNMVYIAVGGFIPNLGTNPTAAINGTGTATAKAVEFKPSLYTRAALTTEFGGFDTVIGAYYMKGKLGTINAGILNSAAGAGTVANGNANFSQFGADLQMQGDLGDVSVGLYLPVQFKGEDPAAVTAGAKANWTGYYPVVTLAVGHFGVRAGYDYTKNSGGGNVATTTKTSVLGAWYSVAQNVELDLEYNNMKRTGAVSNSSTTLVFEYVY